jgi:PAS domain S-box-containing protein
MGLRNRLLERAAANQLESADPSALREYYESVLDSLSSVIYTVNTDLRIVGANQAWDDFALANGGARLTREHVLGSHLLDHMIGRPLQRWKTVSQQLLQGEIPRYLDEVASQEPYAWKNFSLSATPLRDENGMIRGITFVASNITQLKRAENEMFQRLVEIRGLQQVAQTAGTWVDRRRVYKQITSDIAHLFGAEKCVIFLWEESTGQLQAREPAYGLAGRKLTNLSLDMGDPADPTSLWQDLEEKDYILLNEGDSAPADMVETSSQVDRLAAVLGILRVSARIHGAILVAGRARPFTDQDGQLLALFAVPTALSIENTELNRRLLDRAQQLLTAQEQLEQMISVQENARKPLTVIQSYLELIQEGALGPIAETLRPTIQILQNNTQAITKFVSQATPQRMPRDANRYEPVNLADLIRKVLDRRSATLKQAGIALDTKLPARHNRACITLGDPDMLYRVFDGLVENVIKSSPSGGTLLVCLQSSDDTLDVELTDSGIGIPADQLPGIWQPIEHSRTSKLINLAEVKRIVEGHGGQVWAESTPGQGSTFHVVLRKPNP